MAAQKTNFLATVTPQRRERQEDHTTAARRGRTLQTEINRKMDEQKMMLEEMKQLQTEINTKMHEIQTEMNTKMDEQKRERAQVQAVLHMIEHIEEHTVQGKCERVQGKCSAWKPITFTDYCHYKVSGRENRSDMFYSHRYKFQLCIHNDIRTASIGACLYLVTGEYDDKLYWPVEVKVRLDLLNQAGDNHVETTKSCKWKKKERWEQNDKGEMTGNYYFLDGSYMKFTDLEKKEYMMNDCLKYRVLLNVLPA